MTVTETIETLESLGASARQVEQFAWRLRFPAAADADYHFEAWVYDDGDVSLSAKRIDAGDDEYFWSLVAELPDPEEADANRRWLIETTERVLRNPTRILLQKSWLNISFHCVVDDGDGWQYLGGNGALRWGNFRFPAIEGKQREYRSGPLLVD